MSFCPRLNILLGPELQVLARTYLAATAAAQPWIPEQCLTMQHYRLWIWGVSELLWYATKSCGIGTNTGALTHSFPGTQNVLTVFSENGIGKYAVLDLSECDAQHMLRILQCTWPLIICQQKPRLSHKSGSWCLISWHRYSSLPRASWLPTVIVKSAVINQLWRYVHSALRCTRSSIMYQQQHWLWHECVSHIWYCDLSTQNCPDSHVATGDWQICGAQSVKMRLVTYTDDFLVHPKVVELCFLILLTSTCVHGLRFREHFQMVANEWFEALCCVICKILLMTFFKW